jgi:tRNA uridine 5-carbamoylmethylation protein Kti12
MSCVVIFSDILICMSTVYIFRGAPSSGKNTIANAFIQKLSGKVAYIELDKFRWEFHWLNRNVSEITDTEHILAYQNYISVLENYLRDGSYTIVTQGSFSWSVPGPNGNIQDILCLCKKYNQKHYPILLHAKKEVLWERNVQREYAVPREEFEELYHFVMQERSDVEIAIDVGENSVENVVQKLLSL